MKNDIIGREQEKRILEKLYRSKESEFLAVYGRRRVGKTYLIHNFFKDRGLYFALTGQRDGDLRQQLENFAEVFGAAFLDGYAAAPPKSWNDALKQMASALDKHASEHKIILFFDELPWLASRRSGFLGALDYFWNSWASRKKNVIVIICGSAASWMIGKVLHHKGGLHNRVTERIRLMPFTLQETETYLKSRDIQLDRKQVLELYMAMGGVPHYLRQVENGQSAAQNIDRMCFTRDGALATEFDMLYGSLFDNPGQHIDVIRALAKKRSGLTRGALLRETKLGSGGGATKILEALEESGFISRNIPFGKKSNAAVYRLVDEYSLFFLSWIDTAPRAVFGSAPSGYWLRKSQHRAWSSWAGYTFEGICQKHLAQINRALGISGISTVESAWSYLPTGNAEEGAQIDLLIDRADNCINLCEIKFSNFEFVIDKAYARDLRNKRDIFKARSRTRKTMFFVMITTHGTKENQYYEELISSQLTMDDLFGRAAG